VRGFDRDAFVGTKWGVDGHLTVVGVSEYEKGRADISAYVTCEVCSHDTELYGNGVFKIARSSLLQNGLPCGCSKFPKWSDEQHRVKVARICERENYEIVSFSCENLRTNSRVVLRCLDDGHEWSVSLNKLYVGRGCPECKSRKATVSEEDNVRRFRESGRYGEGAIFKRLDISSRKWYYKCLVCAEDEFANAGLCTGEFIVSASSLYEGCVSCRCAQVVFLPDALSEWKIRQVCADEVEFLGWVDGKPRGIGTSNKNIKIKCPDHGVQEVSYKMLTTSHSRCPRCKTGGGFKQHLPGYVYVLKALDENFSQGFTGYGISNFKKKRILTHKSNLGKECLGIKTMEVFAVPGTVALNIENKIREKFPVHSQPISGFKREATFAHLYEDVVAFVKSLLPTPEPSFA